MLDMTHVIVCYSDTRAPHAARPPHCDFGILAATAECARFAALVMIAAPSPFSVPSFRRTVFDISSTKCRRFLIET